MNTIPIPTITPPATLLSVGRLSNRKEPMAVALSPSRTKIAENVATNSRLRSSARPLTRRRSSTAVPVPVTAAR